jgi:opacity protein-like surface antigen
LKKINTLVAILMIIFAVNGLKAQTYPVHQFSVHAYGGYTYCLPDTRGIFPDDLNSGKNPTPYFVKNGYNVGADGKYYVDKKRTFGIILTGNYTMLSSGSIGVSDAKQGTGIFKETMTLFTIGVGAEYDFAPKRPANPFVNVQLTTNFIGGSIESNLSGGSDTANLYHQGNIDMKGTVRFGGTFAAGVDVKLSRSIGVIIGARYCFQNLFNKGSYTNTSTNWGLNDEATTTMKARKITYLQFYAGISFYFGMKTYKAPKK